MGEISDPKILTNRKPLSRLSPGPTKVRPLWIMEKKSAKKCRRNKTKEAKWTEFFWKHFTIGRHLCRHETRFLHGWLLTDPCNNAEDGRKSRNPHFVLFSFVFLPRKLHCARRHGLRRSKTSTRALYRAFLGFGIVFWHVSVFYCWNEWNFALGFAQLATCDLHYEFERFRPPDDDVEY